ncbi:MAG: hypothetical protein ABI680_19000 [Chthoniobacteraceae bacterium]
MTTGSAMIAILAVQHFLEPGFERFAFFDNSRFSWSVSRGEHFMGLPRDHGFSCDDFERAGRQTARRSYFEKKGAHTVHYAFELHGILTVTASRSLPHVLHQRQQQRQSLRMCLAP